MKRKETYFPRDFRETVALRFPARAKELNTAFDMRLSALLAENVGASKEKQYHLKRQILPGIAAYETLQRVMPKEEVISTANTTPRRAPKTRIGMKIPPGTDAPVKIHSGHMLR